MKYAEALALIGGLSRPSKMPWWSWSISAHDCITGSKLREIEGSTCSSCYALKGNYNFPCVTVAHDRRKAALDDPRFVEAFVMVLDNLYARTRKVRADGRRENRFRWFDAGDLQSVKNLQQINDIALRTPMIIHWLPTREATIVRAFQRRHGAFAPNLVVRMSAAMVNVEPSSQPMGLPYSVVGCEGSTTVSRCPALASQGNQCLECDRCWGSGNISYPLH